MAVATGISWVITRLILGLFFFLILTPFGLAMRLIGKRPMKLDFRREKQTYWVDKEPDEPTIDRYAKQF